MSKNEPVMVINNLFAKANNGHKFMFIGGIATKYYLLVIIRKLISFAVSGSFLAITVQKNIILE